MANDQGDPDYIFMILVLVFLIFMDRFLLG